jgi:ABC-type polysaccharide/polyol phosphate transport system ATPase subunit
MSAPAIEVSGLSKRYVIQHESRHDNLRDTLHHTARKLWRRFRWGTGFETEDFWALRDVSFSIQPGEVVGIIGRNGAGKSTLLKILSRITEPTTGSIRLRGRVASLLEVGTGFHPDLTGRENIFLNGAILGMSRAEIRSKFDEIVAFAEIERFLDTPVKRYSSGMYVRLAFAVAAHLEPEILIVDEVLAVGDAQFQKKCLGKMQDVSRNQGRTVLFVSHNLGAIGALCSRSLILVKGQKTFFGPTAEAIASYHSMSSGSTAADGGLQLTKTDPALRVERVQLASEDDATLLVIELTVRSSRRQSVAIEFHLSTGAGVSLGFADAGTLCPARMVQLEAGDQSQTWTIDVSTLANGQYQLSAQLLEPMVRRHSQHEHPVLIELNRQAVGEKRRVLEQSWQAGLVELPLRRK